MPCIIYITTMNFYFIHSYPQKTATPPISILLVHGVYNYLFNGLRGPLAKNMRAQARRNDPGACHQFDRCECEPRPYWFPAGFETKRNI